MAENVTNGESRVKKLSDALMSHFAEICENDETSYSQSMMAKAGEVQDAIYDAINETTGRVDDLVAEIYALAFRHAVQNLWDHGYIVDTDDSPLMSQEECHARCIEARKGERDTVLTMMAETLTAQANKAAKLESNYRDGHDYYEATVANAQYEAYEGILYDVVNMSENMRVAKRWDDEEGTKEISLVKKVALGR